MVSNAELRARARAQLGGNIFSNLWLMTLVVSLIASAVLGITTSFYVGILLMGGIMMGELWVYLQIVRGKQQVVFGDMLIGFEGKTFVRNMLVGLMIYVFTFLWSLLFFIPGIIKAYSYSQAYFVAIDHPEYTWSQCITESRRLMNGKKMKYFLLSLSFIGWVLVAMLTCGIGLLWVIPYTRAAQANFYQSLLDEEAPAVTVETPAEEAAPEA